MPGMFNGKATECTEYIFKMDAYLSTLDPAGKGGEILRAAASEAKDMDGDEVTKPRSNLLERVSTQQCVGIMLDHHDHKQSWHTCSSRAARVPRIWPQSAAGAEQMVLTKNSC